MKQEVLRVSRDGAELSVTVGGEGPPLLYLHGLLAQGDVARAEAPAGFRLATFDQRGHAAGTAFVEPAAYAIDEFVADTLEVVRRLGWERMTLGGSSMGAAVALRLALDHPHTVETLILAGPAFGDEPSAAIGNFDLMAAEIDELGIAGLIRNRRAALIERGFPPKSADCFDSWAAHDRHAIATALRTVGRWVPFPVLDDARRLPMPVVILGWPDDPMHPLSLAERLAERTGAPLEVLSGVAEVLADPDAVSRGLGRLLEGAGLPRTAAQPPLPGRAAQPSAVRSSSSMTVPDGSRQ